MSAAPPSACTVGLQTDGPVSIFTLQRPERLNAINADLLRDLNAQLQTAQADAATRAIVLTGSGRAQHILANWKEFLPRFRKVMPVEYRRALKEMQSREPDEPKIAIGA